MLEVEDTGIGRPPELAPRVFDLFYQGERSLDRRTGGLDIGLTLANRLTELHGGRVTAETIPEFLERRFSASARTVLSVVSLVAYIFTKVSVTVYAGAIVFQTLLPDTFGSPDNAFWVGAFTTVILTGIYTVFGGMRAIMASACEWSPCSGVSCPAAADSGARSPAGSLLPGGTCSAACSQPAMESSPTANDRQANVRSIIINPAV